MSLLDAATNDLAQLISRLDLEATPDSRDISPRSARLPLDHSESKNSRHHCREPNQEPVRQSRFHRFAPPIRSVILKGWACTNWAKYRALVGFECECFPLKAKSGSNVPTVRMTHKHMPTGLHPQLILPLCSRHFDWLPTQVPK